MAPLPANNTNRFFLDYDTGGNNHTLSIRYPGPSSDWTAVADWVNDFLTANNSNLYPWNVVAARIQPAGADISTPVAWPGSNSFGSGVQPVHIRAWEARWLMRSFDGRKTSFSLYGTKFDPAQGFRIYTSQNTLVFDLDAILQNAANENLWVTISGTSGNVYPYVDLNFNSYWEAEERAA